jgi:tetratricopeptide (TPR) repeat protein
VERSEVDVVASGLIGVEGRLSRGEFEAAVADLFDLAKYHPEDLRVRLRLARILHQRALLRYGQGALTGAISDWERVLQLEPGHSVAQSLLDSARAEVAGVGGGGLPEPRLPEIRR